MIKVFLVEDEAIIRNSIKNNVEWKENGYEFVGEATDGEMALPLILKLKPDVVITDIRMPFMTGIELAKLLKKDMPDIHILFLSGYDEFEYAKEAIKLGVEEYLCKPITAEGLLESLSSVKERIEEKRQKQEHQTLFDEQSEEHQQSLRYRFFGELIRGKMSAAEILERGEKLGLQLMAPVYNFVLLKVMQRPDDTDPYDEFRVKVWSDISELIKEDVDIIFFRRATEGYVFLIKGDSKEDVRQRIEDYIGKLEVLFTSRNHSEYFIGVGDEVARITALQESYDSANEAFAYQYFAQDQRVVYYDQRSNKEQEYDNSKLHEIQLNTIDHFLKQAHTSEVRKFVNTFTDNLGKKSLDSFMFCQYALMKIQIGVLEFLEDLGYGSDDVENAFPQFQTEMLYVTNSAQAKDFMERLFVTAIDLRNQKVVKKHGTTMEEAQAFIEEEYQNENLSLSMVAEQVGLSNSHFSTIFKQDVGKSFIEYLTDLRMEKAKELLRCSDLKASEISYQIGYKDPHYFSYLFKKTQDCTPREYRMRGIQ